MDRGKGLFVFGCGRICVLSHKKMPQTITRKRARLSAHLTALWCLQIFQKNRKGKGFIWGLGVVIPCYHDNF